MFNPSRLFQSKSTRISSFLTNQCHGGGMITHAIRWNTSPYPFRPGFGMGSFIPPEIIRGMEQESSLRTALVTYEQILDEMESSAREIRLEWNRLRNAADREDREAKQRHGHAALAGQAQTRGQVRGQTTEGELARSRPSRRNKKTRRVARINRSRLYTLSKHLQELQARRQLFVEKKQQAQAKLWDFMAKSGEDPGQSTFNAGAMSAIDWTKTKIVYKDRASDSVSVDARFFNFDQKTQDLESHAKQVATQAAENFSRSLKRVKKHTEQAVAKSIQKTAEERKIESTLLLTATATHRKVQQFDAIHIHVDLLMNGWNEFWGGLAVSKLSRRRSVFHKRGKAIAAAQYLDPTKLSRNDLDAKKEPLLPGRRQERPKISMVTEAFLGSALIGMVHFLKKEETESEQNAQFRQSYRRTKLAAQIGALSRDTSITRGLAAKAANSLSSGEFDVKFDLVCLGYTPTLKSQDLKYAIKSFKDFDPGMWSRDSPPPSTLFTPPEMTTTQLAEIDAKRQSNMKAVIDASITALQEQEQTSKVLDLNTFMTAFDNYCEMAPTKEGVGIPIGLNVKSWTRSEIARLLWVKYVVSGVLSGAGRTQTTIRGGTLGTNTSTAGGITSTETTSETVG